MSRVPTIDDLINAALDNDGTNPGTEKTAGAAPKKLSVEDQMEKVAAELEEWAGVSQAEEKEENVQHAQDWEDFQQQRMYKLAMVRTMLETAETIETPDEQIKEAGPVGWIRSALRRRVAAGSAKAVQTAAGKAGKGGKAITKPRPALPAEIQKRKVLAGTAQLPPRPKQIAQTGVKTVGPGGQVVVPTKAQAGAQAKAAKGAPAKVPAPAAPSVKPVAPAPAPKPAAKTDVKRGRGGWVIPAAAGAAAVGAGAYIGSRGRRNGQRY